MTEINEEVQALVYFYGSYTVKDVEEPPPQMNWKLSRIDWSSNYNRETEYLVFIAEENETYFLKPYKNFRKCEYEELFGSGQNLDMERVVELKSGFQVTKFKWSKS